MTLQSLSGWLRCPHCAEPLQPHPPLALLCGNGHSFDTNKRGYINLLASGSRMIGDSPAMLAARDAFLEAGHFERVRGMVSEFATVAVRESVNPRVFDAGCGTGYYLAGVLAALGADATALAMDISTHAVLRAIRANTLQSDGLVADTWQPLPVRDATAELVMTVFAPRNLVEFSRVLSPQGSLVVVVPTAAHIQELRHNGRAIDIPAEKAERLAADAAPLFTLSQRERVEYRVELSPAEAIELIGMGPSAHHSPAGGVEPDRQDPLQVTVSVDVLRFSHS